MKIEDRIESVEKDIKQLKDITQHIECIKGSTFWFTRVMDLEKELDKMKTLYEGLHGAVIKDINECEHEWTPIRSSDIRNDDFKIICYDCKKCSQSKPVDKPTQTLVEPWEGLAKELSEQCCNHLEIYKDSPCARCRYFASKAFLYFQPLLQSEYQRGKEDGLTDSKIKERAYFVEKFENEKWDWTEKVRQQAIEEIKERLKNSIEKISSEYGNRKDFISKLKAYLFTESK